jgi:hypothetical protein
MKWRIQWNAAAILPENLIGAALPGPLHLTAPDLLRFPFHLPAPASLCLPPSVKIKLIEGLKVPDISNLSTMLRPINVTYSDLPITVNIHDWFPHSGNTILVKFKSWYHEFNVLPEGDTRPCEDIHKWDLYINVYKNIWKISINGVLNN